MFAVIRTGGKQYRVAKDDVIRVEKLVGEPGATVTLDDVLMIGGEGAEPRAGTPVLAGASVTAELVAHTRGDKVHRLQEEAPPQLPPQERSQAGPDRAAHHRHHAG